MKDFYGSIFGWTFTDYGEEYSSFDSGGVEGGMTKAIPAGTSGPLVILYSDNLEASRDAVAAYGVTLTKDIFEFPGGRRFQFLDPSQNEIAVWGE